jgi:hypothetical protein
MWKNFKEYQITSTTRGRLAVQPEIHRSWRANGSFLFGRDGDFGEGT